MSACGFSRLGSPLVVRDSIGGCFLSIFAPSIAGSTMSYFRRLKIGETEFYCSYGGRKMGRENSIIDDKVGYLQNGEAGFVSLLSWCLSLETIVLAKTVFHWLID